MTTWTKFGNLTRELKELVTNIVPIASLPNFCVLEKLRSDYTEFAVYTPITSDGISWVRWLFTNRLNTGLSGATRMLLATIAKLYKSTVIPSIAENATTGTEGQDTTATQATTDATTRTGTWVGPATVGGVTDIIYSVTIGDKVVYTVTGAERIYWRTYMTSNSGVVKITVLESAVEVDETKYLIPLTGSDHVITINQNNTGQYFVPVASGLDTSSTYTIEIEVHSTNPTDKRAYDGGLRLYDEIVYTAIGRHATWPTVTVLKSTEVAYFPGSRAVYSFTGTKITWKYIATTVNGIAEFKVYDSSGNEINEYTNATKDTYYPALVESTVVVADGLTYGTYYLHVISTKTKNASSTNYRIYDLGVIQYNEEIAGSVGVDSFDIFGLPSNYQTPATIPNGSMFIGTGNAEMAIKVRRTTESSSSSDFVGGTHGKESAMSGFVMSVDDAAVSYAAAANGTIWTGSKIGFSFTTDLYFPASPDEEKWCETTQTMEVSREGYKATVTRTLTQDAIIEDDYCLMMPCPNTDTTGTYALKGCGGPLNTVAVDSGSVYTTGINNNVSYTTDNISECFVICNDDYACSGIQTSIDAIRDVYESLDNDDFSYVGLSLVQDRSDGVVKVYNRAFTYPSGGRTVGSGDSYTHGNEYRVIAYSGIRDAIESTELTTKKKILDWAEQSDDAGTWSTQSDQTTTWANE